MFKLSVRTWILNAAAVLSGQHGDVTRQAEQSGCSRETVYQHARKVEDRLAAEPGVEAVAELREENRRLREEIAELRREAEGLVRCDKATQRRLATTAFAMGVSLRQVEDLLGVLLPAAEVPDHSTLGHWVRAEARRAGEVLKALDPACATRVRTLALDEIFFGGDRPWSGSSRRA
jgi:transposase-like protein